MQQYPAPDKVHAELGDEKHELGDEDERDEAQVLSIDTPVNQRLGQEREHQLQQAAQQHPQQENHNLTTIGFEIFEKEPQTLPVVLALLLALAKVHSRHHQQCHTTVPSLHTGA